MLTHNDAVTLLGACPCPCHRMSSLKRCWCDPRRAAGRPDVDEHTLATLSRAGLRYDPPSVAHNDAVSTFGTCRCLCHHRAGECTCSGRTDPDVAAGLRRQTERDLQRRLRTGRATPAEYLRHAPHLLPGFRRPPS